MRLHNSIRLMYEKGNNICCDLPECIRLFFSKLNKRLFTLRTCMRVISLGMNDHCHVETLALQLKIRLITSLMKTLLI